MSQHSKPPSAKRRFEIAFKALCDISFLGVDADGQDARRIAQEALRAMEMDTVQIVFEKSEQRIRVTSAAGNEEAERFQLEQFQKMITAIVERDGGEVQWSEIGMVNDHPQRKGET